MLNRGGFAQPDSGDEDEYIDVSATAAAVGFSARILMTAAAFNACERRQDDRWDDGHLLDVRLWDILYAAWLTVRHLRDREPSAQRLFEYRAPAESVRLFSIQFQNHLDGAELFGLIDHAPAGPL